MSGTIFVGGLRLITTDLVLFVDVDDTLVRSFGTKRIPITAVIQHLRELHQQGAQLYLWSSGGAQYARSSAQELGIESLFQAFLPKPNVFLDDQSVSSWRRSICVHPNETQGRSVDDYISQIESKGERGIP